MSSRLLAYLEVLFAVTVWGGSFIATKVALREVSPITVIWLRFSMGVVILGLAVVVRKQFAWVSRNELGYFALLGFLGITFHQGIQATALRTTEAATTAWIVATTPVFIAILGAVFLRETLGAGRVFGIALAAVGVMGIVSRGNLTALGAGEAFTFGDTLVLISAVNWAVFSTLSRRGLQAHPATRMMFYVMASGWLFSSIWFFSVGGLRELPRLTLNGWLGALFLGVFCTGLAYIFWYDGLQLIPAAQVGAFLYIEPPVAVVVSALILGEPITLAALLGGALIILGVWLVNRPTDPVSPPHLAEIPE